MTTPFLQHATLANPVIASPVLQKLCPCHVGAGGCRSLSLPDSTSRQVPNFRASLHAQASAISRFFWTTFPDLLGADGKGLGRAPTLKCGSCNNPPPSLVKNLGFLTYIDEAACCDFRPRGRARAKCRINRPESHLQCS